MYVFVKLYLLIFIFTERFLVIVLFEPDFIFMLEELWTCVNPFAQLEKPLHNLTFLGHILPFSHWKTLQKQG